MGRLWVWMSSALKIPLRLATEIFAEMRADALSPEPLTEAIFTGTAVNRNKLSRSSRPFKIINHKVFFANLPNTGQAPNLPLHVVVETPAVTDGRGIHAIQQKPLPTAAAGALATRFAWVETVTEAALEGSREKFIQALILDGAVSSPDIAVTWRMNSSLPNRPIYPMLDMIV